MTRINRLKVGILGGALAVAALSPLVSATTAEARGGKEYFVQSYEFDRPMHGYSGRAGSYYCDYQRLEPRAASLPTARSAVRSRAGRCASTATERMRPKPRIACVPLTALERWLRGRSRFRSGDPRVSRPPVSAAT